MTGVPNKDFYIAFSPPFLLSRFTASFTVFNLQSSVTVSSNITAQLAFSASFQNVNCSQWQLKRPQGYSFSVFPIPSVQCDSVQ